MISKSNSYSVKNNFRGNSNAEIWLERVSDKKIITKTVQNNDIRFVKSINKQKNFINNTLISKIIKTPQIYTFVRTNEKIFARKVFEICWIYN